MKPFARRIRLLEARAAALAPHRPAAPALGVQLILAAGPWMTNADKALLLAILKRSLGRGGGFDQGEAAEILALVERAAAREDAGERPAP